MSRITETRQVRVAICGFGARGRLAFICRIAQDLTDLWLNKPLDKTPRSHDYYDMQRQEEGPGVAFQLQSNAALNTEVPGPVRIDTNGLTEEQAAIINNLTDLAAHYKELTMQDRNQTLAGLENENTSTAILFALASKTGKLDTSMPCGSRGIVGKALENMTEKAAVLQRQYLPWLEVKFHFGMHVSEIDLANPEKPILRIQGHDQITIWKEYDLVVKTTGTTWKVPIAPSIAEHAFTSIPNSKDLWNYLEKRNTIGPDRLIIPGTRIFVGGASLSAFDWVGIILAKTGIVKVDDSAVSCFTIDKEKARQYPGLITFFSRKSGYFAPARHATQGSLPDESIIFSPEMILSHQVQKEQDPYPVYLEMARLTTALGLKKLPGDIELKTTRNGQLERMSADNEKLAVDPAAQTEPYLMQASLTSLLFSYALGRDQAEINKGTNDLKQQYELLVRHPFDASRSMMFNATHSIQGSPEDSREGNVKHVEALNQVFQHVTSAPFSIHHLITQLFDCGVVAWVSGDYKSVTWFEQEELFDLNNDAKTQAHCLIALRMLTTETDLLSQRILAQTKKIAPEEPVYDKGRFPKLPSGARIHVIELGLPGHGQSSKMDPRTVHSQWFDTNSYNTAAHLMPTISTTIRMLESMLLRGVDTPVDKLMALYQQTLPSSSAFAEQAEKLRGPFEECHKILLFARLAAAGEKDEGRFAGFVRAFVRNRNSSREVLERNLRILNWSAYAEYQGALAKIKFEPHDLQSFETTTPDFSSVQIAKMKGIQSREHGQESKSKSWSSWVLWLFWLFIYFLFALALAAAYGQLETLTGLGGHLVAYALARMLLWVVFCGWLFLGLSSAVVAVPRAAKAMFSKPAKLLLF